MATPARATPLSLTVLALLHHKPLHAYGMQQLIKEWGKDLVVNVTQRVGLHRTIDRLLAEGLIEVHGTSRDRNYPERTVYAITAAGRATARDWLERMLAAPKAEFPEFPAALSHLLMIGPDRARAALGRRADEVTAHRVALEAQLTEHHELPRVTVLEIEYLHAAVTAEERWLRTVLYDLDSGQLSWTPEPE
jgi:DNA-binding PadR family transcriptional regulator